MENGPAQDLIFVAALVLFFAASAAYVRFCEKL